MARRVTCKGRNRRKCGTAKKSCSYASGTKRSFCRKRRSTRRNKKN